MCIGCGVVHEIIVHSIPAIGIIIYIDRYGSRHMCYIYQQNARRQHTRLRAKHALLFTKLSLNTPTALLCIILTTAFKQKLQAPGELATQSCALIKGLKLVRHAHL